MGTQLYDYTRTEHEYHVSVPQLMVNDPELTIYMSAHGGGTVGKSYRANGWDYALYESDWLVLQGSDLRSPEGRGVTHAESARTLAGFLSAAGEHYARGNCDHRPTDCEYREEYSPDEQEWLAANHERLALFTDGD